MDYPTIDEWLAAQIVLMEKDAEARGVRFNPHDHYNRLMRHYVGEVTRLVQAAKEGRLIARNTGAAGGHPARKPALSLMERFKVAWQIFIRGGVSAGNFDPPAGSWWPNRYYGGPDQESLTALTRHEAIIEILDDFPREEFPETIDVVTYDRVVLSADNMPSPLDWLLEQLEEQYGYPGSPDTEAPEAYESTSLRDAERFLLAAVRRRWLPWRCNPVSTETVDVAAWLQENPGYLQFADKVDDGGSAPSD